MMPVPSVAGVLVQYPLYAGMVKMMTESGLASRMAHFFVEVSTQHSYPVLVGIYSAFLGLFVPLILARRAHSGCIGVVVLVSQGLRKFDVQGSRRRNYKRSLTRLVCRRP